MIHHAAAKLGIVIDPDTLKEYSPHDLRVDELVDGEWRELTYCMEVNVDEGWADVFNQTRKAGTFRIVPVV